MQIDPVLVNNIGDGGLLQGAGVGLRSPHLQHVNTTLPDVPWFEILVDNYLNTGGVIQHYLYAIAEHYPLSCHGVGMSLGSTDPLNMEYLSTLKQLIKDLQITQVSEHLCWTSKHGYYSHELLPMPYTDEAAQHIADRIIQVQEYLGCQILIENVSSYMTYSQSEMTEWQFLNEVIQRADCHLLADINNIFVSASNHQFDPYDYINAIPAHKVKEIHLAGFEDMGQYLLDTHGAVVNEQVWTLFSYAIQRWGKKPTLIEWDNNIPEFDILCAESAKAQLILNGDHSACTATTTTHS
ncbi:Uncharacterized protein conserved in bacteria, NMA0228-like [hydrothermal vent metagenome]|uniref:Uncharacterized protein conserved in bacteria, NMA0228-like n=1 Tax=hydrothermal vent metagenome TaxID=652676 RepID=A0A3B0YWZ8_9ZZZZ